MKKTRCIAIFVFSFFLAVGLPASGQHLFTRKFSSEDYNAGQNFQIAQDNQGIIYVTNNEGLLTYDGEEWGLVPLPDKLNPYSIAIDSTDKVFIGSEGKLGYCQKDSTGNYTYHSLLPYLDENQQGVTLVHNIEVFKGSVFFFDEEHIYVFTNGKFKVLDIKTTAFKSTFVVGDHLYISGEDNKLYEYTEGGLTSINNDLGTQIWAMAHYRENTSLVLDNRSQLWLFNPDTLTTHRWRPLEGDYKQQLGVKEVIGIKPIKDERVALFTWDDIMLMNGNGKIYAKVSPDYLENYLYQDALLDANHNLWVVCPVNVLHISTSSPLCYLDNHDGFKGQVISMAKKGSYQYVGTGWGIYYRGEGANFQVFQETYPGEAWNFCTSGDRLFAVHREGVFELNEDRITKIIDNQNVMSLCKVKKNTNTFIMGTYNTGIWLLSNNQGKWKKTKIKGFEDYARFMHEDKVGNIWISHYRKGVWRLRLNAQMDSVISRVLYDKEKGLPSNINNRIYKLNSGKIVATTVNGIYNYNPASDLFEPEAKMNQALGENICIYSLRETEDGDLYFWGAAPEGKETAGALKKRVDGSYKLMTSPFGKISGITRKNRIDVEAPLLVTEQGELWIGNKEQLIIYNPHQQTYYDDPVPIHIKYVHAKDSMIFINGQTPEGHPLPYEWNNLDFEFTSTFYESEGKTQYQYKLKGFEDQWSAWSTSKQAIYTNIPEGSYTFMVRAKNVYGRISDAVNYTFAVKPPWYRTVWAYLAYVLLLALLVYLLIYIKTKNVEQQKKLLERKVNEKTKELLAMNKEMMAQNEEISSINEEVNNKNIEITKQAKELKRTNTQLNTQKQLMLKNMKALENTQQVMAKQTEELKELNFTKDKIFSIISHDLQGSVNQLPELLNLLEAGHMTTEEFKSLIPDLKESALNLSSLTDNLLHWAKSQIRGIEVKQTSFKLDEIVEENARLSMRQAQRKNIALTNAVDKDQYVFADKDMIRLLLRNLISNAIKFTPTDGKVTISTQTNENFIYVSVADTGIGLDNKEIDKILGKEYHTKRGTTGEKGSGLGLKLCREFAEKNGGALTIESTSGQGSRFTFSIPLQIAPDKE